MRVDAIFIGIELDDAAAGDTALGAKLEEVCPVDIFRAGSGGSTTIVEGNVDECILCGMCLTASGGKVAVHKLYSGEQLTA